MSKPYLTQLYYIMTLEPLHVGTKEMALGRVDNTIIRDQASGLPKIPATSLSGATRGATALHYPEKFMYPVTNEAGETVYASCSGRGSHDVEDTCGQRDCPVCVCYGFKNSDERSLTSMVQFQDSHILFYPVATMAGPVWIVSLSTLRMFLESDFLPKDGLDLQISENSYQIQTSIGASGKLNMGWVLLDIANKKPPITPAGQKILSQFGISNEILRRTVAVPTSLFGQLVNNNLEVRTSNAIDKITGTVMQGALFTYEAVPRGTIFWTQVVYKDPSHFSLDNKPLEQGLLWVQQQVELGLRTLNPMGLGGKVTRGMGRVKLLNLITEGI
ncbi:type III-B CRISPR module RAMP protein Cmr4 [Anaerolineales bacterium HSG24]|nr:type III-B CRISPR module RAMP protein Cmr4 [Anaerolineales bacterium HSG24]